MQLNSLTGLQQTGKSRPASILPVRTVHLVATHCHPTAQIHKTHAGAKLFHQRLAIKLALLTAWLALDGDHRSLEISKRQQAGHISIFSSTIFFITFCIGLNLLDESIEQQPSRDDGGCPPDSCPLTHRRLKNKNRTYQPFFGYANALLTWETDANHCRQPRHFRTSGPHPAA
ncbi:hypothetical protein FHS25_006286 [Rhizobium laguerreae]|uniref:Uncharacterized protein n=1 Tax=Rhizobium laguerreae TaxID=1076926 RepID=A0ABR6GHK6_9HYPH|nr:hypothetical protein [Rhizobium laguerreae]MBB3165774.1 hypothetical protein [Rhizobium laguerreae]